jgi:hypothetical protein
VRLSWFKPVVTVNYYKKANCLVMRRTLEATVILIVLFGVFLYWLHSERQLAQGVRPPRGGTNFTSFLELRPDAAKVLVFTNGGKAYLEVVGPMYMPGLSLPSGPAAYIFSPSGALVDWVADNGDTPSFYQKWTNLNAATPVTIEQARKLIKAQAASTSP